jgi:5-oxopent-3-ene-1,2,5-tricarboxylate decarboxylase/2-hydroxyhepta-2,4-diene-1,7-dioate isomerase
VRTARIVADGRVLHAHVTGEGRLKAGGRVWDPEQVTFLPPVTPRSVIGLALNYADHATELQLDKPEDPALFAKSLSSLIGHRAPVIYPRVATHCHYETELAVVIGRSARRVSERRALEYVQGYTVANDFTCRDFVKNVFRPPIKAKGFDTFGPLGPYLVTADEVGDPGQLRLTTHVNGELRQEGNTRDMVYGVPALIEYLSYFMTLEPGDVILTGTPRGISPVHPGDVMVSEVEGIGRLENPVVAEETPADDPAS